jgi:hypothetical protein
VTDTGSWQPPVAPQAAPADSSSPWVSASPTTQANTANTTWRPPPKPGLIPLQPLGFGTILGSSFRVMRRNPGPTFGLALLTYGLTTLGGLVLYSMFFLQFMSRMSLAGSENDANAIFAGSTVIFLLLSIIPFSLSIAASAIMQGIISLEVARGAIGERLTVRGLWRLARGRIAPLIGWSFLIIAALIVVCVVFFIVYILFIALAVAADNQGAAVVITIVFSLVFFGGAIVLSAWLGIKLVLVPSILVLERKSLGAAIRRSWSLTRGFFWRTFGTLLLINVIVSTATQVITFPLLFIFQLIVTLLLPNGGTDFLLTYFAVFFLVSGLIGVIIGSIGLVAQSSAMALIYLDIRMRKEGLDLELMHFVESKNSAAPTAENPFERVPDVTQRPAPNTQAPWG